MLNKDFKKDWKTFSGEIVIADFSHAEISFDKEFIGLSVDISLEYRMIYIKVLNLVFRIF